MLNKMIRRYSSSLLFVTQMSRRVSPVVPLPEPHNSMINISSTTHVRSIHQLSSTLTSSSATAKSSQSAAKAAVQQQNQPQQELPSFLAAKPLSPLKANEIYAREKFFMLKKITKTLTDEQIYEVGLKLWASADEPERAPYLAAEEREEIRVKFETGNHQLPEQPMNPFAIYWRENSGKYKQVRKAGNRPPFKPHELAKAMGDEWKALPESDRRPYVTASLKDQDRYRAAMDAIPSHIRDQLVLKRSRTNGAPTISTTKAAGLGKIVKENENTK